MREYRIFPAGETDLRSGVTGIGMKSNPLRPS
nr:MAG TPA: hypothetical protein [Caudoviricetes sp.]